MSRPRSRPPAMPPKPPANAGPTWAAWPGQVQAFQLHAARDMMGVFNRYVAALAAARDAPSINAAQCALVADLTGCIDGVHRQWAELARAVPVEGLAALGWRMKPAVRAQVQSGVEGGQPNLVEQSTLGLEMLLRPWMGAPDLEHTDEFVA